MGRVIRPSSSNFSRLIPRRGGCHSVKGGKEKLATPGENSSLTQVTMRIISYSVDQFDSQFAQRLNKSARALKLDCDLYRWSRETMPPADRIRYLTILRSLSGREPQDVLFADPQSQFLQRPDILLDEKDFD